MEPGSRARANVAFAIAFAVFAALLVRLYDVQVAGHSAYAAQSDRQSRGQRTERAGRGPIRDATGEVLAVSVPRPSIGVDPTILTEPASVAALSRILGRDAAALMARTREDGRPVRFAWLKRFATDDEAAAVQALKLKGVTIVTEFDRQYGRGRLLAHVLGITGSEDEGGEGLERRYDRLLRGGQSTADLEVDGRRRPVEPWDAPDAGGTLRLTIDARFQKIVEEEIDAAVAEFRPKWAAAVALDPRTGDVLAMTCRPGFDPAAPAPPGLSAKAAADARRNRVLTDPYEPGSTFKPFIVAWAIEKGLLTPASKYDCEMGSWTFGPRTLHDHHAYGVLTVTEIVAHSSNIGAVKIGATVLGKQRLHDAVKAFGFGEPTGIDLPAEENGVVHPLSKWSVYSITSIPMGHEIAVTPLQLAAAMGVFASGGQLMKPRVVAQAGDGPRAIPSGRRVLSAKTCAQMRAILAEVMTSGTGREIKVEGVSLAGKTGTTQKLDRHGNKTGYISSFAGFAPVESSRIVLAVVIDEPQGAYYGSAVAAPVFARILRRGWAYVN